MEDLGPRLRAGRMNIQEIQYIEWSFDEVFMKGAPSEIQYRPVNGHELCSVTVLEVVTDSALYILWFVKFILKPPTKF